MQAILHQSRQCDQVRSLMVIVRPFVFTLAMPDSQDASVAELK